MNVSEILNKAADLIEPEGAWTQGTWARTANGSDDAAIGEDVCWCAYGAIRRASEFVNDLSDECVEKVRQLVGDVITWNDAPERTQAEVVAALRAAAQKAAAQ